LTELLPNLGGEEGSAWRNRLDEAAVRAQRNLWRLLFPTDSRLLYGGAGSSVNGTVPFVRGGGVVAWINTEDGARDERVGGRALVGASPAVVTTVHDKAFAQRVATRERLVPEVLRDRIALLEPEVLHAPDAAAAVEAILARWPPWARARFTLKPRLGCNGRGRVAGRSGRLDRQRLGGALDRLAGRGGAVLEPWLQRTGDLSVQLRLGGEAGVTVLGSLEQVVSPAGVFRGHRGQVDSRGRVFSGHADEEHLREAAVAVAVAARAAGYEGPCGVDAFTFADPESRRETLRPVVELNARFTAGTVTVALVRGLLPRLRKDLGLGPGERLASASGCVSAPTSVVRSRRASRGRRATSCWWPSTRPPRPPRACSSSVAVRPRWAPRGPPSGHDTLQRLARTSPHVPFKPLKTKVKFLLAR